MSHICHPYIIGRIVNILKLFLEPAMVLHACNPSYSGGRDWEDGNFRPAQAKS
jgi:hypothetical protein